MAQAESNPTLTALNAAAPAIMVISVLGILPGHDDNELCCVPNGCQNAEKDPESRRPWGSQPGSPQVSISAALPDCNHTDSRPAGTSRASFRDAAISGVGSGRSRQQVARG